MKKIIKLTEEDVLTGMIEDTVGEVSKTLFNAIVGVTVIYIAMVIVSGIIIEHLMHSLLAIVMLTALYVFSILALKSYSIIQLTMLNNIVKLKNTEDIKNGSTNNGKNNEKKSNIKNESQR